jgi:hypothetical protein
MAVMRGRVVMGGLAAGAVGSVTMVPLPASLLRVKVEER